MKIEWKRLVCVLSDCFLKPRNGHGSPEKVTWNRKPMEAGWIDLQIYIFYMTCLRGKCGVPGSPIVLGQGTSSSCFHTGGTASCCGIKKDSGGGSVSLPDGSDCSLQMFKRLGHFEI